MQISLQERAVGGQVDHQLVNFAEGQHPVIELVIQQVTAAFAVIGNKVLVIPGDVDPLHMLRGTEADQHPFALVKAEHRLIVEDVGHRPVRRRLARHGAGMGMAEMAVDAQGAEQVVRGNLLVNNVVQLLAAHRMVESFPVLRLEPGHHRERRFLLRLGFARAAVGAQLIDLTAEGDQLPVQLIKGAEAEIAVFQQVGDGGAAFVNPAQQGAHERCLIEQMTSKDIDGVFEVEKNCFEHHWSKDAFKKELNNEVARYLVAKLDGKVVGYVGIWFVMDEGHITNVAVHSDYRGRKIGDKLVQALVELCRENNIVSMTLEVRVSNIVAQNLYKKYGFKLAGIRKEYYSDNKEDAMIMWNDIKVV